MSSGAIAGIVIGCIAIVLIIILIAIVWFKWSNSKTTSDNGSSEIIATKVEEGNKLYDERLKSLNEKIAAVQTLIDSFKNNSDQKDSKFIEQLTNANKDLETLKTGDNALVARFDKQHDIVNDKIEALDKTIKAIKQTSEYSQTDVSKIKQQVEDLNNIFVASNKKRGNLGEYILNKLLEDIYGNSTDLWEEQYKLSNGTVDAIVKTGEGKENIAIDSKFPLTDYNNYIDAKSKEDEDRYLNSFKQGIKERIKEVAKYINKDNNISNAIMFIPSEELFSLVYRKFPDVVDYALQNKVWMTSPTTLAALLSLIDRQNADVRLNKNLGKVKDQLLGLKTEFNRFSTRWDKLKDAQKKIDDAISDLDKTTGKIQSKYEKIYDQSELDAVDNKEND